MGNRKRAKISRPFGTYTTAAPHPTLKGVLLKRAGTGTERGQPCPRSGNLEIPVRIAHERARGQGCPRSVPFGQQALKGWAILRHGFGMKPSRPSVSIGQI